MDEKYPVMKIVRERLADIGKDLNWLGLQTGRTTRWYHGNPEIEKIEYQVLVKMSKALNFDFIADHRKYLGEASSVLVGSFQEQNADYQKQEKKIHLQMSIAGTVFTIQQNYPKLLQLLQDEAEKMGFEIQ